MPKFNDFNPEYFDKLKIFLITNFNIRFFNDSNSSTKESFEITTNEGKIIGHFFSDNVLEVTFNDASSPHYEKIYSFIKKLNGVEVPTDVSEQTFHKDGFDNFLLQSKTFFEHVSKCRVCKIKFLEIMKHLK